MGDLQAADQNLSQAVVTMEAAIISLPSERRGYQERLRTMLREHATVKRALGDTASALALEQKAAGLSTNP
jgi:uncharacterized protein YlxW (UPF0749 family)